MNADSLAAYNGKRDFAKTAEPQGTRSKARTKSLAFVVQKHAASRLHWDFRLELDGVLLSWAVTRGPTRDAKVRRLAVRTEDHPLSYGSFEGTIPKGQYGGGTVMLWDRGTWEPVGEPHAGLVAGKFHFHLHGARMKGEWVLIRLKPDDGQKAGRENWLLFKIADEFAVGDDLVAKYDTSVSSGRTMDAIIAANPAPAKTKLQDQRSNCRAECPPAFREPQLATLVGTPPTGNDWLHETKYDGYRALISIGGGTAIVRTRSGLDWTEKFHAIATAAAGLPCDNALIDCEICAIDAEGRPNFGTLQATLKSGGPLVAFVFDLIELAGADLSALRLTERKSALMKLLEKAPPQLIYAEHVRGGGERMFAALCEAGYEGVVSKRADAPYRSGRSRDWRKSKCTRRQEFVIGGWSTSEKGREFASLLVGVNYQNGLRYTGRVGTGFDDRTLADLNIRLEALSVPKSPFSTQLPVAVRRRANWVRPELVAEVVFAEFTPAGNIRHGSFIGLREDKSAAQVVDEKSDVSPTPVSTRKVTPDATQAGAEALRALATVISSADRIVFPDLGLTKEQLAEYYALLAPEMLVDMCDRPISLVRCPQGRAKACFFQKHDSGMFPESVHHIPIVESDGKTEDYLYVDNAHGILACVQMGTIEFHGWGSRIAGIECPDRLVIDLDPDESLTFEHIKAAAVVVRQRLKARGLESLPMVTGGKGVHVVAPLVPEVEWSLVKAFARGFAEALAAEYPTEFTANMSKARRKGRIFIDWLRNQRGATAVMPYSVRAREGAGVAVPVSWQTLAALPAANAFSAADARRVLAQAKRRPTLAPVRLPKP